MNSDLDAWSPIELVNIAIAFSIFLGVLLFSTWQMIRGKQWYWWTCSALMWSGILSFIGFMVFGIVIDDTGAVFEYWVWVGAGKILFGLGFLGVILRGVIVLYQRIRGAITA